MHERKRHEHTLGDGFGVRIFDREDAMELVSRLEAPDLQANPVVSREGKVQPIYVNGAYLARNPRWHLEESAWKAVQIRRILRRNQISPATVCDVGCGAGEVLSQLQKTLSRDCNLCGYDISPQAIDRAMSRANERLYFRLADFCGVQGAWFDLLLVLDVFEHVEDYYGLAPNEGQGSIQNLSYSPGHFPADGIAQRRPLEAPLPPRPSSLLQQRDGSKPCKTPAMKC